MQQNLYFAPPAKNEPVKSYVKGSPEREQVIKAIEGLEVVIVENTDWRSGQGRSVATGVAALPVDVGGAIFLLSDQPMVSVPLLRGIIAAHAHSLYPIVAPLVDGQRGNPVLFDRVTFADLKGLQGDTGGRALLARFPVEYVEWHDPSVLLDIDSLEDYRRAKGST